MSPSKQPEAPAKKGAGKEIGLKAFERSNKKAAVTALMALDKSAALVEVMQATGMPRTMKSMSRAWIASFFCAAHVRAA